MAKILWLDIETTGLNPEKHGVIQIAGIIEIDGKVVEEFDLHCQPFLDDQIDYGAIVKTGTDLLGLGSSMEAWAAFKKLLAIFDMKINKFEKTDKFIPAGYNVKFDIEFLDSFFRKNNNLYMRSYIGQPVIDVMSFAHYLAGFGRIDPESFKLADVCSYVGLEVSDAHDAMADITATRNLAYELDRDFMAKPAW